MKYGKKIRQISASCELFKPEDWIQYKALKKLIQREAAQKEFLEALTKQIEHCDEIFVQIQSKQKSTDILDRELATFAQGNSEGIRKIVKKYRKKIGIDIDVSMVLGEKAFYVYNEVVVATPDKPDVVVVQKESETKKTATTPLRADATPFVFNATASVFTPSAPAVELSENAAVFTPREFTNQTAEFVPTPPISEAGTPSVQSSFAFSVDAPAFTPSIDVQAFSPSMDAPVFSPSNLSVDAIEFFPGTPLSGQCESSKPMVMDSDCGITEGTSIVYPDYDTFARESLAHPLQLGSNYHSLTAPPEIREAKPKVYVCDVETKTYSLDWLLEKRLEDKLKATDSKYIIPKEIQFPLHSRTSLWQDVVQPVPLAVQEQEFDFGSLSRFVTPVFCDEINYEDVCDPFNKKYGPNALKALQPRYRDIHPDLLDKPEILCRDTINNICMQFLASAAPFLQTGEEGGQGQTPEYYPGMFPGMNVPFVPGIMTPDLMSMYPGIIQKSLQAIQNVIAGRPFSFTDATEEEDSLTLEAIPSDVEEATSEKKETSPSPPKASEKTKKLQKAKSSKSPSNRKSKKSRNSDSSSKSPRKELEKLHKATRAWSRRAVVVEEEDLAARTMQSILNKLVPEKFDRLLEQALKEITVTKKETLLSITKRLHKKSISEADYAPLYAHFVRKLRRANFKSFSDNGQETNMEDILLDLCLERLKETDEADEEDKEQKSLIYRRETLGNYTLLGELYKREVLCHEKLSAIVLTLVGIITNPDESHDNRANRVEQLLHLLKSCGTEFEEKCKQRNFLESAGTDEPHVLEQHFIALQKVVSDQKLKPRVRFMIQDLVELKNKHWEFRNTSGIDPKFLSEIREDIRKEKVHRNQHMHSIRRQTQLLRSNKKKKGRNSPRDRKSTRSRRQRNRSKSKAAKKKDVVIETSTRSPKIDKIKWAKIVQGLTEQNASPKPEEPKAAPSNVPVKCASPVLKAQNLVPVKCPSPLITSNAWARGPPQNLSLNTESNESFELATNISSLPSDSMSAPSESSNESADLDTVFIETKLMEYFEEKDIDHCVKCFEELLTQGASPPQVIFNSLNLAIERNEEQRNQVGDLLIKLAKSSTLSPEDFEDGFSKAYQHFTKYNIQLDVPRLPIYMKEWQSILAENDILNADALISLEETRV